METNNKNNAIKIINELERKLLPQEYLSKILHLFLSAQDFYLNHSRSALEEIEEYLILLQEDTSWLPHYIVSDGEFSNNEEINKEFENMINIYFALIKKFTELTIKFANNLLDKPGKNQHLYGELRFLIDNLHSFRLSSMAIGLLSKNSHDAFKDDIHLMQIAYKYFETGTVDENELKNLDEYKKRLYPWSKIEIYEKLSQISKKQMNASIYSL